jgi:hypothetical protein
VLGRKLLSPRQTVERQGVFRGVLRLVMCASADNSTIRVPLLWLDLHDPGLLAKVVELSSSRRQGDFESGLNLTKKTDSNIK